MEAVKKWVLVVFSSVYIDFLFVLDTWKVACQRDFFVFLDRIELLK